MPCTRLMNNPCYFMARAHVLHCWHLSLIPNMAGPLSTSRCSQKEPSKWSLNLEHTLMCFYKNIIPNKNTSKKKSWYYYFPLILIMSGKKVRKKKWKRRERKSEKKKEKVKKESFRALLCHTIHLFISKRADLIILIFVLLLLQIEVPTESSTGYKIKM